MLIIPNVPKCIWTYIYNIQWKHLHTSQDLTLDVLVLSGGRHAMALTADGKVFSWGEGDDGKLGHLSRM